MIGLDSLRWALTAVFSAVALFHVARWFVPRADRHGHRHRLADVLHLAMAVAMIVMVWPFGELVPVAVWLVVFAAAALWFVAAAARAAAGRVAAVFFASAMAAMVWMGAAMPASAHAATGHGGMAMPEHGVGWLGALVGCYFVGAGLLWVVRGMGLRSLTGFDHAAVPGPSPTNPSGAAASFVSPDRSAATVSSATASPVTASPAAATRSGCGGSGPAATGPHKPLDWLSLCHGVMSAGMGLAVLTMM